MADDVELGRGEMPQIDAPLIEKLSGVVSAARRRATSLRDRARRGAESVQLGWMAEALQELDVAHEGLRVTEEALRLQAEQLVAARVEHRAELEQYRALFDEAPEPYLVSDMQGVILRANRQACQLLAVDLGFLAGEPIASFVAPEDRRSFSEVLVRGAAAELVTRFALRVLPRGAPAAVLSEVSVACGWLRSGQPSTLRFILHRPAPPTQAEATLPTVAELGPDTAAGSAPLAIASPRSVDLERARPTRSDAQRERRAALLSSIHAELRSPLNVIQGWLELLADRKTALPLRERARTAIARNVQTLGHMLEQLIDDARAADQLLAIQPCATDLADLVRSLVESREQEAEYGQVALTVELDPELPLADVDPVRLRQVLFELLSNALESTPRGGSIRVSAAAAEGVIAVAVDDSGRGIEPKNLTTIFEPFVRLDSAGRRAPGLGLGLRRARHLVELHGGTLSAASEGEGRGARFELRCPVTQPAGGSAVH